MIEKEILKKHQNNLNDFLKKDSERAKWQSLQESDGYLIEKIDAAYSLS